MQSLGTKIHTRLTRLAFGASFLSAAVAFGPTPASALDGFEVPPYIASKLAFHHHPLFRIVFYDPNGSDGPLPRIVGMRTPPTNLGIETRDNAFRFREVHTHEGVSGTLHVESPNPVKKYRLGEFFALWIAEDPRISALLDRVKAEGAIYLFDYVKQRQSYLTTRVANDAFLDLPLDDNRHIVIFLPGTDDGEPPMVPAG